MYLGKQTVEILTGFSDWGLPPSRQLCFMKTGRVLEILTIYWLLRETLLSAIEKGNCKEVFIIRFGPKTDHVRQRAVRMLQLFGRYREADWYEELLLTFLRRTKPLGVHFPEHLKYSEDNWQCWVRHISIPQIVCNYFRDFTLTVSEHSNILSSSV
jgi:hypothetical protein